MIELSDMADDIARQFRLDRRVRLCQPVTLVWQSAVKCSLGKDQRSPIEKRTV